MPISVVVPPKIAAKESGISSFDGATPIVRASWITTGISTTTIGVLFMRADRIITPSIMASIATTGDARLASRETSRPAASITPVRSSAADNTNMAAIVIGAEFEKTESASGTDKIPVSNNAPIASSATTSAGRTSLTKPKNTIPTSNSTMAISTPGRVRISAGMGSAPMATAHPYMTANCSTTELF